MYTVSQPPFSMPPSFLANKLKLRSIGFFLKVNVIQCICQNSFAVAVAVGKTRLPKVKFISSCNMQISVVFEEIFNLILFLKIKLN